MKHVFAIIFLVLGFTSSAQRLQRQTIQVAGASISGGGNTLLQSCIGQSSPTTTFQGFIQSAARKTQSRGVDLKVFPNPTDDVLFIGFNAQVGDEIELYDNRGVKLQEYRLNQIQIVQLDVTSLPAGNYFIKINRANSWVGTKKFIKSK